MGKIRILLADDHIVMRRGLRLLLEAQSDFEIVGEAADGLEAVQQAGETSPDVAVIDLAMPHLSGLEATRRISEIAPQIAILVLSMHSDGGYVANALQAGAKGYVLKDCSESDLVAGIRSVSKGVTFFSHVISQMLLEDYVRDLRGRESEDRFDQLTWREREVLQLLAEGKSNKEVAARLGLSAHTVETHRRNLQDKLNIHSYTELVLYALRKRLIT